MDIDPAAALDIKVERLTDLTENSLTQIFQSYFQDTTLSLKIISENKNFLNQNDQFQSNIKKWEVLITRNETDQHLSFIVKSTNDDKPFHLLITRLSRQFFTETFWYKHAFPELIQQFPELSTISPTLYHAYSNYEDSFHPDSWDTHCSDLWRMIHHKNEQGIILMENACEDDRPTSLPPMVRIDKAKIMSLAQVNAAVRHLAMFHGTWWTWLTTQQKKKKPEYVTSLMNIDDVETAFMRMKKVDVKGTKVHFDYFIKQYVKLARAKGLTEEKVLKVERYAKKKMYEDAICLFQPENEKSVMKTMTHGDFWSNNILFSSADPDDPDLKVTFLDFQQMCIAHPSKDIWYLLYVNTDREFREMHLKRILYDYFMVFSGYLSKEGVSISYETFEEESSLLRAPIALIFGAYVCWMTQNPEPLDFTTWRGFQELKKAAKRQLGSEPREDEDSKLKEIKRRIIDIMNELVDFI